MRVLLLEDETEMTELRQALRGAAELLLVVRLEAGLGGVWSDYPDDLEIIRIGYPKDSRHRFFRPLEPVKGADTCASVALGRIVFGRQISDVVLGSHNLAPVASHALAGHHVRVWCGEKSSLPEHVSASFSTPADPNAWAQAILATAGDR